MFVMPSIRISDKPIIRKKNNICVVSKEEMEKYIANHPEATLEDFATHFGIKNIKTAGSILSKRGLYHKLKTRKG